MDGKRTVEAMQGHEEGSIGARTWVKCLRWWTVRTVFQPFLLILLYFRVEVEKEYRMALVKVWVLLSMLSACGLILRPVPDMCCAGRNLDNTL